MNLGLFAGVGRVIMPACGIVLICPHSGAVLGGRGRQPHGAPGVGVEGVA